MVRWPATEDEYFALADSPLARTLVNEAILGPCVMDGGAERVELRVRDGRVAVVAHRASESQDKAFFPAKLLPAVVCRLLVLGRSESFSRDATGEISLRVPPRQLTIALALTPDGDAVEGRLSCSWTPLPS